MRPRIAPIAKTVPAAARIQTSALPVEFPFSGARPQSPKWRLKLSQPLHHPSSCKSFVQRHTKTFRLLEW